jgi:hypothetical protein
MAVLPSDVRVPLEFTRSLQGCKSIFIWFTSLQSVFQSIPDGAVSFSTDELIWAIEIGAEGMIASIINEPDISVEQREKTIMKDLSIWIALLLIF